MPSKAPTFQFYYKDWLVSTAHLTLEERGAYITLLAYQWDRGGFRARELPVMLGALPKQCARIWKRLRAHFHVGEDGLYRNPRLEKVRDEQQAYREAQTQKAQRAARMRWDARSNAQASSEHSSGIALQSASASASHTKDVGVPPNGKTVAVTTESGRTRLEIVPSDDPRPAV